MELEGAHVLITDASRGIGAAMARSYAARGAKVSLVARNTESGTRHMRTPRRLFVNHATREIPTRITEAVLAGVALGPIIESSDARPERK